MNICAILYKTFLPVGKSFLAKRNIFIKTKKFHGNEQVWLFFTPCLYALAYTKDCFLLASQKLLVKQNTFCLSWPCFKIRWVSVLKLGARSLKIVKCLRKVNFLWKNNFILVKPLQKLLKFGDFVKKYSLGNINHSWLQVLMNILKREFSQ